MTFLCSRTGRNRRPATGRPKPARLELEPLEERSLLSGYQQLNLVGFQPGMARYTDPNLNGWGLAFAPDGPFCVANTATGKATFYDAQGKLLPTVVTIPAAPGQPLGPTGSPTGAVYNPTSDFVISANGRSAPATFLFDTLDGLVCGWNPAVDPNNAIILVDNSAERPYPASYNGLALSQNSRGQNILYATDSGLTADRSNNRVDMFNGTFHSRGSFTDRSVARQYPGNTAFQVEDLNGRLYVTFGGFTPPFGGVVDVFDTDGHLLTPNHFAANAGGAGPLENPWGVVLAPADFGVFSNDLLIGNVEGDGNINAFDPKTGAFLGRLTHPDGTPIAIPGLWDLAFGGGTKSNGKTNQLFFTAGPNADTFTGNGLFGMIQAAGDGGGNSADAAAALALPAVGQGNASAPGGQQTQPAALPTSGPALALGAPPIRPASAPGWLAARGGAHRVLDQVFADPDGSTLADALRLDRSHAGAL
jgi:uncharacterized protein (TIGR03118 family)